MKNKNENIDIKLKEKVEREFNNFKNKLRLKSKEEIKNTLEYMELHPKEKQALLKDNDLLGEFYHDWLNTDRQFGEVMEDTMGETVEFITRHYNKNQNER